MIERTLVLIKPDGVQRGLIGEVIKRFENCGLKIVAMKLVKVEKDFAKQHYPETMAVVLGEKSKKSYDENQVPFETTVDEMGKKVWNHLLEYITSAPVIAMVLEGVSAVKVVRKIVGVTAPADAQPGTIRGDFAHINIAYANIKGKQTQNIIHASGTSEEAKKEIELWFRPEEIFEYKLAHEHHIV